VCCVHHFLGKRRRGVLDQRHVIAELHGEAPRSTRCRCSRPARRGRPSPLHSPRGPLAAEAWRAWDQGTLDPSCPVGHTRTPTRRNGRSGGVPGGRPSPPTSRFTRCFD
jgi:hypothetical protein